MSEKATPEQLLGSTARWTAAARARESVREDRLFHDPGQPPWRARRARSGLSTGRQTVSSR
jgi:hypothetical protein